MEFRVQSLLFGCAVLFLCISSYSAFPADLDYLDDEAKSDVDERGFIPPFFPPVYPPVPPRPSGAINSIKAVGFNKNAVQGNLSGNFAVANATDVLAAGFNVNDAKGDASGNFKVGR